MTIRTEIRESLAALSLDNTPTPERQEKSQFSTMNNIWRVRTIAERLYGAGRIQQDVYNSCQTWARTYILMHDGPGAIQNTTSTSIDKHDAISFVMDQALREDSIPAIREVIGKSAHNLLVLTLYNCFSAGYIASMIKPENPSRSVEKAIDLECISAYEKLNEFYFSFFSRKMLAD